MSAAVMRFIKAIPFVAAWVGLLPEGRSCPSAVATDQWPGWEGIKYAFVFGDSYSTTGFNYTLAPQPSAEFPLGNPDYPGHTSSNGPNWVDLLTTKHNASVLLTYNFAFGGATVDSTLVGPYQPGIPSLVEQVQDEFLPAYGAGAAEDPDKAGPQWTGANSLFALWLGINDVHNSYARDEDTGALNGRILAAYADQVESLWGAGARNLVLVNVPPVERSPSTAARGAADVALEGADIADWNARLAGDVAAGVRAAHPGEANVWVYDAHATFAQVMDRPETFPETAGYRNTTKYCVAYQGGTPEKDTFEPDCGIPVDQYFWLNDLHPTYPVHDLVARQISEALLKGPGVYSE